MAAAILSLVTFGIFFLVLVVRWSRWRDAWAGGAAATPFAKWGAWAIGASVVLVAAGYGVFITAAVLGSTGAGPFADAEEDAGDPSAGLALVFGFFVLVMLGFAGFLAGRVLLFIAQWRVWGSLQERLSGQGRPPRIPPIGLLLIEIFGPQAMQFVLMAVFMVAMVVSFGVMMMTGLPPLWLILLYVVGPVFTALPILWVIHETQKRVLEVARPWHQPRAGALANAPS